MPLAASPAYSSAAASSAARKQTRACSLLESKIAQLTSRRAPLPTASSASAQPPAQDSNLSVSQDSTNREYERLVKAELDQYIRDGVLTDEELDDFDLCRWWQVRS